MSIWFKYFEQRWVYNWKSCRWGSKCIILIAIWKFTRLVRIAKFKPVCLRIFKRYAKLKRKRGRKRNAYWCSSRERRTKICYLASKQVRSCFIPKPSNAILTCWGREGKRGTQTNDWIGDCRLQLCT